MAQFEVFRNNDPASRRAVPFLLDIQSDLLEPLATRVVVPLAAQGAEPLPSMKRLMPVFEIEGRKLVLATPQLAGVSRSLLGARVASLADRRHEIVAALDVLITGV
jgi:toxin CcdB